MMHSRRASDQCKALLYRTGHYQTTMLHSLHRASVAKSSCRGPGESGSQQQRPKLASESGNLATGNGSQSSGVVVLFVLVACCPL